MSKPCNSSGEGAMTFPIVFTNTGKRYKKAFRFRWVRDLSIALVFIVPFLGLYRIELVYLTLVPWLIAGAIYIHNYALGIGHSDLDPVGIRDWRIEVDQYVSFSAALKNDRFIEIASVLHVEVELFEGETFFKHGHRPEPRSEMRRIIFRTVDGRTYSIDRQDRSIRNLVKALDAWNESRMGNYDRMFEERMPEIHIECGKEDIIGSGGHTKRRTYGFVYHMGVISIMFGVIMVLMASPDGLRSSRSDPMMFLFLLLSLLMVTLILLMQSFEDLEFGLAAPNYVKPLALFANSDSISFSLEGGWMIAFPWSSIRGLMASSTEEYPHPITMDSLWFNDEWGAVVFDGYLIYLKKGIADEIRSAYKNKFGFAPQQYWYSYSSAGKAVKRIDDYSQLQNRPRS